MPRVLNAIALLAGVVAFAPAAHAVDRVDDIRNRGYLVCGLAPDHDGFGVVSGETSAAGLDADFCRGIAAAMFGSAPGHLRFKALETINDFLASDVDVVFHELTWTFNRELTSGLAFGPIYFFDGQAFLARRSVGASSAAGLPDATVCVEARGGFVDNMIAFIQDHAPGVSIALAGPRAEEEAAFFDGECDLLTGDASELYSAARAHGGGAYMMLSDRLSKEPLTPVVRAGDDRLLDIVRWSIFATIEAEELGATTANVDTYASWGTFGSLVDGPGAAKIGLGPDWARAIIRAIGNYGEIYERNLGASGNVGLPRGLNELWTRGGLLYSPPLQ